MDWLWLWSGFKERPGTDLVDIDVNIYCERESHKGMVIGKRRRYVEKDCQRGAGRLRRVPGMPCQSAVLGEGKTRLAGQ